MPGFNFADSYKAAGLTPGPEVIRLRQEPFDRLLGSIDPSTAVILTRLYFGLPVPGGTDWFCAFFVKNDPSFTMFDNQREAAVLSVCLLMAALHQGKAFAGLAPLAASAAGNRSPVVRPDFLEEAKRALHQRAVASRVGVVSDFQEISARTESKVSVAAAALAQAGDWAKAAELFNQVSEESSQGLQDLSAQLNALHAPLLAEIRDLREEVDILWWYLGGWSRVLERPFVELEPALAAAMAGFDLARLTKSDVGPAAAPAILQRLISGGRGSGVSNVTIKDAADAFPAEKFGLLDLGDGLNKLADICPVLTGFLKAFEAGVPDVWHGAFRKAVQLEPTAAFHPLQLAMQVYRETLLTVSLA